MVMIGIDPHKRTRRRGGGRRPRSRVVGAARARAASQAGELVSVADTLDVSRTSAIESAGGLGYLLAQQLLAAGSTSWTFRRRWRRGSGCWAPAGPTRTIPTMHGRCTIAALPRADVGRGPGRGPTRLCCACWRAGTPRSPGDATRRPVDCTRSSASSWPAGSAKNSLFHRPLGSSSTSNQPTRLVGDGIALPLNWWMTSSVSTPNAKPPEARIGAGSWQLPAPTLTEVFGIGDVAATLIGHTGSWFPTAERFAASRPPSNDPTRSPSIGCRDAPDRTTHCTSPQSPRSATRTVRDEVLDRERDEGHTGKGAPHALKRRISDVVYRHLVADQDTR